MKCKVQDIDYVVIYRSPGYVVDDLLLNKLNSWSNRRKSIIVDNFNALSINWGNLEVGSSRTSSDHKFLKATIDLVLFQYIRHFRTYDLQNSPSVLSLLFTHSNDII